MNYLQQTSFLFKLLITFFLGCSPILLHAQNSIDLFEISGRHTLDTEYEKGGQSESERGFTINAKAPIEINDKLMWYSNIIYNYNRIQIDFQNTDPIPLELHGLYLQSGIIHQIKDKYAIHLLAFPRLVGTFNELDSDHLQIGGIALFEKRCNDRLKIRFGALYNGDYFGPFVLPLFYIYYDINDDWSVDLFFPIKGRLSKNLNDNASAGLAYNALISSFWLPGDGAPNHYIQRSVTNGFLFYHHRLVNNFYLEANAGIALSRDYQLFDAGDEVDFQLSLFEFGDDRQQRNISFNNATFLSMKVVYNLPIPVDEE